MLATFLSLGRATGEEAGAACLDFSKAYDSLDLQFLEQALHKAGVAEQILRPAFSMYKALPLVLVTPLARAWNLTSGFRQDSRLPPFSWRWSPSCGEDNCGCCRRSPPSAPGWTTARPACNDWLGVKRGRRSRCHGRVSAAAAVGSPMNESKQLMPRNPKQVML